MAVTPGGGIGIALTAACLWGVFLFLTKRHFSHYAPSTYVVTTNAIALCWYVPVVLATRPGADLAIPDTMAVSDWGYVLLIVLALAGSLLALYRALAAGDVSRVAPISKIIPVFVLPLEVLVLGQYLTPLQLCGVLLATAAVYLANYQGGGLTAPLREGLVSRPAQLALLSAALFGVVDFTHRIVLQEIGLAPPVLAGVKLLGVAAVLSPFALRAAPASVRADWPKLLAVGALVGISEHATVLAFSAVPASIASSIVSLQAVVATLLGGVFLRERPFGTRVAAAGLAFVGITLITLT